jgi:hypothetical protein
MHWGKMLSVLKNVAAVLTDVVSCIQGNDVIVVALIWRNDFAKIKTM